MRSLLLNRPYIRNLGSEFSSFFFVPLYPVSGPPSDSLATHAVALLLMRLSFLDTHQQLFRQCRKSSYPSSPMALASRQRIANAAAVRLNKADDKLPRFRLHKPLVEEVPTLRRSHQLRTLVEVIGLFGPTTWARLASASSASGSWPATRRPTWMPVAPLGLGAGGAWHAKGTISSAFWYVEISFSLLLRPHIADCSLGAGELRGCSTQPSRRPTASPFR